MLVTRNCYKLEDHRAVRRRVNFLLRPLSFDVFSSDRCRDDRQPVLFFLLNKFRSSRG